MIQDYTAVKVDASCNYMSIEFGMNDGDSIGVDKNTAYGRYLIDFIKNNTLNGSTWPGRRFLGIITNENAQYLMALNDTMSPDGSDYYTPTGFRKFMTYVRKISDMPFHTAEELVFTQIQPNFGKYAEIKQMEKIVK